MIAGLAELNENYREQKRGREEEDGRGRRGSVDTFHLAAINDKGSKRHACFNVANVISLPPISYNRGTLTTASRNSALNYNFGATDDDDDMSCPGNFQLL